LNILHITNGDSAVHKMHEAGIKGKILPWRDVLHEGPVPADQDLAAVSSARATHLASLGWIKPEDAASSFRERDALLANAVNCDRIILWFEHDLYDQLQLLQLLDWFSRQPKTHDKLFLLNHDDYLGAIEPAQIRALAGSELPVTPQQLQLAQQLWQAFTYNTPEQLAISYQWDCSALPFMHAALYRLLQILPRPGNGLNRTEQQALQLVGKGISAPDNLFWAYQQTEQARFMGDASFWLVLEELCTGDRPLLGTHGNYSFQRPSGYPYDQSFMASRLRLTEDGQAVLQGELDATALRPLDRWVGGTHLQPDNLWRWDAIRAQLLSP